MSDNSEAEATEKPTPAERRRRGRRPADAHERRTRVMQAIAELESAHLPFAMADVAERAGISRATLYRDASLRDLIGNRGAGLAERPVHYREFEQLRQKANTLGREQRRLKALLRHAEQRAEEATKRAALLEEQAEKFATEASGKTLTNEDTEKIYRDGYAEGFSAGTRASAARSGGRGGGIGTDILTVAARLPRTSLVSARRSLVRALHPDLFANDPAAQLLATELLKQINALVGELPKPK